jgi:uncharacterized Fe-S cluster-containing radical SAM superfamily protein
VVLARPGEVGKFYTPSEIAECLTYIAGKKHIGQLRVSGSEPAIGREHLLELLGCLKNDKLHFILETNGILIGADKTYAQELSEFPFVHVRVSLKGCSREEFSMLTNAQPDGFDLQLRALRNLVDAGVSCHPSVMSSFSSKENIVNLKKSLSGFDIEDEELILYPNVRKRLKHFGLEYLVAHEPDKVPERLV